MDSRQQSRRWCLYSAGGGMVCWLLYLLLQWEQGWNYVTSIERLLLLAVLVFTPLALALVDQWQANAAPNVAFWWAYHIQPLAAVGVMCAFLQPAGTAAAMLSLPWFFCTGLIALAGLLLRKTPHQHHPLHEWVLTIGMLYLPIGAGWLVLNRFGARPLAFPAVIVLLTAVHFHYTGFVVPVIATMTGRFLARARRSAPGYPWLAVLLVIAMPLIAVGITFSPGLEAIGVLLLFSAIVGLAGVIIGYVVKQIPSLLARRLLTVAACAMVAAIIPALLYGAGELVGRSFITIPRMVQIHGFTNAFGFITCSLIGWLVAGSAAERQSNQRTQ